MSADAVVTIPCKALLVILLLAVTSSLAAAAEFAGSYCRGRGDAQFLDLIDRSFAFFHPNPDSQNISMLYVPDSDALSEGAAWGMWWVQNSYGPTYCVLPFLQEPWLTALQHSQDFWFKHQGDGKSKDSFDAMRPPGVAEIIPPDGCLVDAAHRDASYHRQGDCKWWMHDWCFGFTAAGVVLQSELLLISRDMDKIGWYLPNLERACNFIETARDPKNNLFLVGPAANLLAPSYGGVKQADGSFGKAYLAEISVTYLAALERMVELFRLAGDDKKQAVYEQRARITRDSLSQCLTDKGYFVKYIEPDGTKHGVYGQEQWGYFEVAPNVDAVCFRAVDQARAERIYWSMAAIPELRPNIFLITNYPGLDDIYDHWGSRDTEGLWTYGMWINGGVWTTMEARAIMAYYRLGKFEDVRRSALKLMEFTDRFQMDAPLKDFGRTPWFDQSITNFCYDALGVPAATIRGLFEYIYRADSLTLYPHVPATIEEYAQLQPVRFGPKRLTISVVNGGPRIKSARLNGEDMPVLAPDHITLPYDSLPVKAHLEITMTGGWSGAMAPSAQVTRQAQAKPADLPDALSKPFAVLDAMTKAIKNEPGADYERAYLDEAVAAFSAYRQRAGRDAAGAFAGEKPEKRAAILKLYEDAAASCYKGFDNLMKRYAASKSERELRLAKTYAHLLE